MPVYFRHNTTWDSQLLTVRCIASLTNPRARQCEYRWTMSISSRNKDQTLSLQHIKWVLQRTETLFPSGFQHLTSTWTLPTFVPELYLPLLPWHPVFKQWMTHTSLSARIWVLKPRISKILYVAFLRFVVVVCFFVFL